MQLPPFLVDVRRVDGEIVVAVSGELDVDTSPKLEQLLEDLIPGQGNMSVTLDLTDLGFIDSTGVRALLRAQRAVPEGRLTLIRPTPQVRRVLDICGLTQTFTVADGSSLSPSA